MQNQTRVPVLNVDGQPIMPTKASRARRWLREGKAKVVHNDLGVFQIQLLQEASGTKQQDVVVGIDQGKLYTGIAVQSAKSTLLMLHLELPLPVVAFRMKQRAMLRKTRRSRRINRQLKFKLRNHRQKRIDNPTRKEGFVPPSINSNKQFERRIIIELNKIFPLSHCVFELIKAKGSKSFSHVIVGQRQQEKWLNSILPTTTIEGWKTSIIRDKLGLVKNKTNKSIQEPATHAVDGVALACHHFIKYIEDKVNQCADWFGSVLVTKSQFVIARRPSYSRRQLYQLNPKKHGKYKLHGGSSTLDSFRKGDLVLYTSPTKTVLGYCSGSTAKNRLISISDVNWNVLGKYAITRCKLISRSCGILVKVTN